MACRYLDRVASVPLFARSRRRRVADSTARLFTRFLIEPFRRVTILEDSNVSRISQFLRILGIFIYNLRYFHEFLQVLQTLRILI